MARPPHHEDARRAPRQQRSRALVDAILEAATRVFSSARGSPYEEPDRATASTNRIAEVAGVSIGSLYQYFRGRTAIVAALVRKRMRETHEALLDVTEESHGLPLERAVPLLVDRVLEMKAAHMEIDQAIVRETLRHALTKEAFALDAELVTRFAQAIERWKPAVREGLPAEVAAHMLFQGFRAVMVVGAIERPDLTVDPRLRTEMIRLFLAYLSPAPGISETPVAT